jgi:hypothetical protein
LLNSLLFFNNHNSQHQSMRAIILPLWLDWILSVNACLHATTCTEFTLHLPLCSPNQRWRSPMRLLQVSAPTPIAPSIFSTGISVATRDFFLRGGVEASSGVKPSEAYAMYVLEWRLSTRNRRAT